MNAAGTDNAASSPLRMKILNNESYASWDEIELSSVVPQERDLIKKRRLEKLSKMSLEDQDKH